LLIRTFRRTVSSNARIVESIRGAKGGYQLRRPPSQIRLSEVIRLIDGPLAPFGDADQLRVLIARDVDHRALYQVFLDVRTEPPVFWRILVWLTLLNTRILHVTGPANAISQRNRTEEKRRVDLPFRFLPESEGEFMTILEFSFLGLGRFSHRRFLGRTDRVGGRGQFVSTG
jgi:hypothetical protein